MKWINAKKYRPIHSGDQLIWLLRSGYIHAGIFYFHNDRGYFFESHEGEVFEMKDVSHFCVPDPIEIIED